MLIWQVVSFDAHAVWEIVRPYIASMYYLSWEILAIAFIYISRTTVLRVSKNREITRYGFPSGRKNQEKKYLILTVTLHCMFKALFES